MKKVVGIISVVLFIFIEFQSCVAGLANTMSENNEVSGSAGFMLGIFMLIAGILVLASKNSKGIVITSIVFYVLAGIIGFTNAGSFKDLTIWASLCLIFAILLGIHLKTKSDSYKK